MAEKQEFAGVSAPPRPTIALPPRQSMDAVFGPGASPGPLTMVSRFFSDCYTDPEYRSFSQLLAGAMQSPMAGAKPDGGEKMLGFKQSQPVNLVVAQPSFFTVPPGLSPSGLLNSPGFFSSPESPFGMSHQQALAQVTAQAAISQSHLHFESAYAPSLEQSTYQTSFNSNTTTNQQLQPFTSYSKSSRTQYSDDPSSEKKSQPSYLPVDKPADDGYNWRKYGQKQVKGSEYPRSYYKCTHLNCPVKKQVERSLDGHISEIIYRGQHNHERPPPNKRSKDGNDVSGNINNNMSNETVSAYSVPGRDQESVQLSRSGNREEVDSEMKIEDNTDEDDEPNPKRRNTDNGTFEVASSQKAVAEPKIIVQTRSEVDLLDDGYRWRKYGQKVVKGNPHPRSYYRCTYAGCNVRKHVERASADPKAVITTYEGKHNHDLPAARTCSHNTANNNMPQLKAPNMIGEKHALVKEMDYGNAQRPVVLQLKEEQVLA